MRNAEYDRFGPWVLEISEKDPPPPLFVPYLTRTEKPLLSIKIPRPIERRNASPGMNLYDYVLNMFEQDFQILRREEEEVITNSFSYNDIVCLCSREVLLNGTLILYNKDSIYEFSYSTVSSGLIQKIIEIIRRKYTGKGTAFESFELTHSEEQLDFYFSNLIKQEKDSNPGTRLFALQPRTRLSSIDGGLRKFLHLITSKQLLETLHFCDGREIKITSRGKTFKYLAQAAYGKEDLYIPVANLRHIEIEQDLTNEALLRCRIKTDGGIFSYFFTRDNPTIDNYKELQKQYC